MHDVSNIWRVPLLMQSQGAHHTICKQLGIPAAANKLDMHAWKTGIADRWAGARGEGAGAVVPRRRPLRPRSGAPARGGVQAAPAAP
jgi:hypothetical protein